MLNIFAILAGWYIPGDEGNWSEGDKDQYRDALKLGMAMVRRESHTKCGLVSPMHVNPGEGLLTPIDQVVVTPGFSMPTPDYENEEENEMRDALYKYAVGPAAQQGDKKI